MTADRRAPGARRLRLHGHPPLTPAGVLLRYRFTVPILVTSFALLALAAGVGDGGVLATWDEPVQRTVEENRTPTLTSAVRVLSHLGGLTVVVVGLAVLLGLVWHRCRSLAVVLFAAVVARPLLEWTLKALVDRPRPNMDRLVAGTGPSFPSGHVMAAIALWGLLPPVVALFTARRRWWWWSVAISATIIGVVAVSRVYLGVHWLSDVAGALLLGSLYLLAVEWLFNWHHERRPCAALRPPGEERAGASP